MILYPKVGRGIRNSIAGGICKREDLFVTSKLWNTYHHPQHVEAACRKSLEDLGLDYLDLYLIHFPISLKFVPFDVRYPPEWIYDPSAEEKRMEFQPVSVRDTWAAMESLVDKGLVRNIGLSNWNCQGLRDVLTYARIKPAVLQIEVATNENISLFYLRNISGPSLPAVREAGQLRPVGGAGRHRLLSPRTRPELRHARISG